MAGLIHYNYAANYDELDAIKASLNDATALREDVHQVFNALADVYDGEAAAALQLAHIQVSQMMDGVISDIQATQQAGVERQGFTSDQDRQLAGGF